MGPPGRYPSTSPGRLLFLVACALWTPPVTCEVELVDRVFLPASLEVTDAPEYFRLQQTGRYLHGNASLTSRTETFLLTGRAASAPVVRATYGDYTALQEVPSDLLTLTGVPVQWSVRAVLVEGSVSPSDPYARVLFHLMGKDWLSDRRDLPCITLQAFHQTRSIMSACRIQAPLGVCVVELEFPQRWFSTVQPTTTGRRKVTAEVPTGVLESAEMYYTISQVTGKKGECGRKGIPHQRVRRGGPPRSEGPQERLAYVGSVEMKLTEVPRRQEVRIDRNVVVRVPDRAVLSGEVFTATVVLGQNFTADIFHIRIKFKRGLYVIFARAAVPEAWTVKMEKHKGSKHLSGLVTCRRIPGVRPDWSAADFPEFLYLDFGVENATGPVSTRRITWQVEYPGSVDSTEGEKVFSEILVSERDLRAIIPLSKEEEILNTAPLTGVTRRVPVKLVAIETGGFVIDVSDEVGCSSSNIQIVQVTDACDFVYVGGKESRGAHGVAVNFWYERLRATLQLTVWIPLLPLRIEVSDTRLEQIRGWRVASAGESGGFSEQEGTSEEGASDRRVRGCRPQYQRASVRFLAHFVAHPLDGGRHLTYLLGSDWLLDVSPLVRSHARVRDPRVALLEEGSLLIGREPGVTSIEVRSPVSLSILGEQALVVSEEKVSILEVRAQMVTGISLVLGSVAGYRGMFTASCQAKDALQVHEQEVALGLWLVFSDVTIAPVELYDHRHMFITASSMDQHILSLTLDSTGAWPMPMVAVAEGRGEGPLLHVSLQVPEPCRKGKHRTPLASGTGWIHVDYGEKYQKMAPRTPTAPSLTPDDPDVQAGPPFSREEGAMLGNVPTLKTTKQSGTDHRGGGVAMVPLSDRWPSLRKFEHEDDIGLGPSSELPPDFNDYSDGDIIRTAHGVTDLEVGMYVLLGVFCLAIFIFLINCVAFILRYRHKKVPEADSSGNSNGASSQPHNWVWLGTDQDDLSRQLDMSGLETPLPRGDVPQGEHGGPYCGCRAPVEGAGGGNTAGKDWGDCTVNPGGLPGGRLVGEVRPGPPGEDLGSLTSTFHPLLPVRKPGTHCLDAPGSGFLARKELHTLGDVSRASDTFAMKERQTAGLATKMPNTQGCNTLSWKELCSQGSHLLSTLGSTNQGSNTLSRKGIGPYGVETQTPNTLGSNTLTRKKLSPHDNEALNTLESDTLLGMGLNFQEPENQTTKTPGSNTLSRRKPGPQGIEDQAPTTLASNTLSRKKLSHEGSENQGMSNLESNTLSRKGEGSQGHDRVVASAPGSNTLSRKGKGFQGVENQGPHMLGPNTLSRQAACTEGTENQTLDAFSILSAKGPSSQASNNLSSLVPGSLFGKELRVQGSGLSSQEDPQSRSTNVLGTKGSFTRMELEPLGMRRRRAELGNFAPRAIDGTFPAPIQSILVASEEDIMWVCEDMGLRDPEEVQSYMERIRGSS
ncbi:transmembrane protein 132A [Ambystoma mexicanum]|uniref:transmembrane protein 132A n=1 Tax=Ambystoma mexicanum TaxID=8296 RepID=UPI0037E7D774